MHSPTDPPDPPPWHQVWPAHLPTTLEYPDVPAWWLLHRNLERFPDRPALCVIDHESGAESHSITYSELWRSVRALARSFQDLGIDRGDRVALALGNSPELVMCFHATWLLGATVAPINPAFAEGEAFSQLADAEVNILVATASRAEASIKIAADLDIQLV